MINDCPGSSCDIHGDLARTATGSHHGDDSGFGAFANDCWGRPYHMDVLVGLLASLEAHQFLFGRFTTLADARGCTSSSLPLPYAHSTHTCTCPPGITAKANGDSSLDAASASASAPGAPPAEADADVPAVLAALDAQLRALYAALPARTAFVVFTGHADPRAMAALNARKAAFEGALRMGKSAEELGADARWTSADGRALEEEVERAKRGLLFLAVKGA